MVIGHLGRDPEIKHTSDGTAIASFSVAASEKWKGKDGQQQEHTEWFNCSAFGRTAEVAGEYLRKGAAVYVEGSLRTETYTGKDGAEKKTIKLRVQSIQMLGGKGERGESAPRAERPAAAVAANDFDDDIPF
jgi:single-strand DNA-binding protein